MRKKDFSDNDLEKSFDRVVAVSSLANLFYLSTMNMEKFPGTKYLRYLGLPLLFGTARTKEILRINPTIEPKREEARDVKFFVYDYNASELTEAELRSVEETFDYKYSNRVSWINIDGIRKKDVEVICQHFDVHYLLMEDILSINQRPKMDEADNVLFCLLNMLYFNEEKGNVEQEQISIVLGKNFVLSFQEDAKRDVFNPLREKLRIKNSKLRHSGADYLCYAMLDLIVDNYFVVMEKLGDQIELVEEEVLRRSNKRSLVRINQLRKELIILKRNIAPVQDLVAGIIRSESELLEDKTIKYFKDVYDHILQAHDLSENYRDVIMSLQDLYVSNVNLKLNEVMKVMAIVTCLLAPATVISGIFGMNFDIIPYAHHNWGFYFAIAIMFVVPLLMLYIFKRRGWF